MRGMQSAATPANTPWANLLRRCRLMQELPGAFISAQSPRWGRPVSTAEIEAQMTKNNLQLLADLRARGVL